MQEAPDRDDRDDDDEQRPARLETSSLLMFCTVSKPISGTNRPKAMRPAKRGLAQRADHIDARGGRGRLGRHAQTFSTSGRPRRPGGRKISTMARIEKAATSL